MCKLILFHVHKDFLGDSTVLGHICVYWWLKLLHNPQTMCSYYKRDAWRN